MEVSNSPQIPLTIAALSEVGFDREPPITHFSTTTFVTLAFDHYFQRTSRVFPVR